MSKSRTQMKTERKNPLRYRIRLVRRSTPDLLASGVATLTFNGGDYTIHVDTVGDALKRDQDAIVWDAITAYSRLSDEREPA
jgi:hypothetical protein